MISSISARSLTNLKLSNNNADPIRTMCLMISIRNDAAIDILKRANEFFQDKDLKNSLPSTLAFINKQENQSQLLKGGRSCERFISGLQTQFQIDSNNNIEKQKHIYDEFLKFIKIGMQTQSFLG
jgi:hypothetical protein